MVYFRQITNPPNYFGGFVAFRTIKQYNDINTVLSLIIFLCQFSPKKSRWPKPHHSKFRALNPFIARSIKWDGNGTYFEPFMGSGVVGFNLAPKKAVFGDTNPHIIRFYQDLQNGIINSKIVGEYLADEGAKLSATPADKHSYYYEVRQRFNQSPNSLDFLFLQRANFNGMMRFNASGEYNVPFGRKPQRFQSALITKIRNQVNWVENLLAKHDWTFVCQSFEKTFKDIKEGDFVYLDPPYINRHDGYYDNWSQELASRLAELTKNKPKLDLLLACGYRINIVAIHILMNGILEKFFLPNIFIILAVRKQIEIR